MIICSPATALKGSLTSTTHSLRIFSSLLISSSSSSSSSLKPSLKPCIKHSLRFLYSSSKTPKMSEPKRTVADVLMGNARAAAARKKATTTTTSNSSPKKRKSPELPAKDQNLNPTAEPDPVVAKKKTGDQTLNIQERIAELKKKPTDFNPSKAAFWKEGEPVSFRLLARALDMILAESGRIAKTDIICNVFRTVMATTPKDLAPIVYLSVNKIALSHAGLELGIGDAALFKTLADAYGTDEKKIKSQLQELGLVAKAGRQLSECLQSLLL